MLWFCFEGTLWSASAHIITVVVGSGVLSLAWCLAQLGWIIGILLLVAFAIVTWFMCILLTDCYRSPDPVTGSRNYNYMQAVKVNLGKIILPNQNLCFYHGVFTYTFKVVKISFYWLHM